MPLIVLGFCSDSTSPRAHSYYYNLPPLHVAVDHAAREQLEQRDRPGRRSCSDWPGPHHRGSQRAKDGGWRPRRRSDCQVLGLEVSERSERALGKQDYEPLLNQLAPSSLGAGRRPRTITPRPTLPPQLPGSPASCPRNPRAFPPGRPSAIRRSWSIVPARARLGVAISSWLTNNLTSTMESEVSRAT